MRAEVIIATGLLIAAGQIGNQATATSSDTTVSEAVHDSLSDTLSLNETEIDEAIAWGLKEKRPHAYFYGPILSEVRGGLTSLMAGSLFEASGITPSIIAIGPFGRVAAEATAARRRYMSFDRSSVSADARAPVLVVRVEPPRPKPGSSIHEFQPGDVERVVLLPKAAGVDAVQPIYAKQEVFQWQNGFGATFSTTGMTAIFPLEKVPPGDFNIVVITNQGETRAFVGKKDREMLR